MVADREGHTAAIGDVYLVAGRIRRIEGSTDLVLTIGRSFSVRVRPEDVTRIDSALAGGAGGGVTALELAAALVPYALLASPALTGTPTAPTAGGGTNTTQIATTAFVQAALAALVNAAPGALDTLDELAAALGDDASFAVSMATALAGKQLASEKGNANGYASLDAGGKVPSAQLPSISGAQQIGAVRLAPTFATAGTTSAKTITTTNTFALYMGKAPAAIAAGGTLRMRYQVTTAAATITWAELAVATGAPVAGGNPTLTVQGFANVAAVVNSTGLKTTAVTISVGQSIAAGDDIWLLVGCQATTACALRAQSIADTLQTGAQASGVLRPSLIVGTPTAYTIEGTTTLAAWLAIVP